MRRSTTSLFFLFLLVSGAAAADVPIPAPPSIGAEAYIIQDFYSGKVIVEHNADERMEPASLTKMMTAYIVFDAVKNGRLALEDTAPVSEKAWRNPGVAGWTDGSRMFAEVGTRVSISDLLRGLIVQSGNDAAVVLAEHLAGTEDAFVDLMNDYAARLGLEDTHYRNSTGWPAEEHYTSARDVALLARALIGRFPDLYALYSEKRFTYNNISQANRNSLLWKDDSVDGIKTGYTESAGYCLAASAERDGMRLVSVVMGADSTRSRTAHSQSLLNYAFRFYETHRLFAAGEALKQARVWRGDRDMLDLGLSEDVYVTIPRGQYEKLKPMMSVRKSLFAPLERGEQVGTLEVLLDEQSVHEQPLIALDGVGRGNVFQRLVDRIGYILQ